MTPEEREQELLNQRIDEAEAEIHAVLKKIFRKGLHELNVEDKAFLQARRSYLDDAQLSKYDKVLKEKLPRPDGKDVEEEKEIEALTRKELEAMATNIGISEEDQKKARKNSDLQELIKNKQEELEKGE